MKMHISWKCKQRRVCTNEYKAHQQCIYKILDHVCASKSEFCKRYEKLTIFHTTHPLPTTEKLTWSVQPRNNCIASFIQFSLLIDAHSFLDI